MTLPITIEHDRSEAGDFCINDLRPLFKRGLGVNWPLAFGKEQVLWKAANNR
jgi:hypothetical protein